MTSTIKSSADTGKAPRKSYHHGDLRQSLLDTATVMIREGGLKSLSMRKLADRTGVSRTAPYHHFKDKNELLCAIAEAGFRFQERSVSQIRQSDSGTEPARQFEQYVQAYIRFAGENPETYDLMFGREIWKLGTPTESLKATSRASFRQWVSWIEQMQHQQVFSDKHPALRVAQVSWATLHGLCRLLIDGIYLKGGDFEEMGRVAADMLLNSTASVADPGCQSVNDDLTLD